MAHGNVHEERDLKVDMIDLGGCVEGVSISFVRAISRGASMIPAILAAATATAKEAIGTGEERMSKPPAGPVEGLIWKEIFGSGTAKTVARKERVKEVMADNKTEWT